MTIDETLKFTIQTLESLKKEFEECEKLPMWDMSYPDAIDKVDKAIAACEDAIGKCSKCDCHFCECDEYRDEYD